MTVIGHTVRTRVPHRGPAPGPAQSQMSVQVDRTLRGTEVVRAQAATLGLTSRPIAHRKAAISRAMAVVTTVWRLPAAISRR